MNPIPYPPSFHLRPRLLPMALRAGILTGALVFSAALSAQVVVSTPDAKVSVGGKTGNGVSVSVGSKNEVSNNSGVLLGDVEMEGVAVLNGEVYIDGDKVPKTKTRHTGRKSGITYIIKRGKDGNVAVSQE